MYETVKIVNGHGIFRMKGTHGAYHVTIRELPSGARVERFFNTIKAATAFCETL